MPSTGKKLRELLATEFHVWAERGGQVLLTDEDVRHADAWLVAYADAFLESHAPLMLKHALPKHLVEAELRWMRDSLSALVLHYKAENRRCRMIREEELRRSLTASETPGQTQTPTLNDPKAALHSGRSFPNRAEWLMQALEIRKWTVQDLERHGGPGARTTRKILQGQSVRETVLEKLAFGLSVKTRVRRTDIPRD